MITFKNALVYYQNELVTVNVTIKDQLIVAIGQQEIGKVINFDHNYLLTTNFIDLHAHFREPGQRQKDTLKSSAQAALFGGYQLVCLMANTNPVVDNQSVLAKLKKKTQKLPINVKFFSAITKNLEGTSMVDYHQLQDLVIGYSDDGKYLKNHNFLEKILRFAQAQKKLVSLHVDNYHQLKMRQIILHHAEASKLNHRGTEDDFESKNLINDLEMVVKHQLPYHLCHISTGDSVAAIKKAKSLNPYITCEVTPHHLVLNHEMINNNCNYKINPPLSSAASQNKLIEALNQGVIDVIASDHAPHERASKKDLITSAVGAIGLQTTFAAIYTYLVLTNQVKLATILSALTINCAKLINYSEGELKINGQANFVIIDLKKTMVVTKKLLKSKAKNSPFLAHKLTGWPVINVIAGKIHYLDHKGKRWWKD